MTTQSTAGVDLNSTENLELQAVRQISLESASKSIGTKDNILFDKLLCGIIPL